MPDNVGYQESAELAARLHWITPGMAFDDPWWVAARVAGDFLVRQFSHNSSRGYGADLTDYGAWCRSAGLTPLAAKPLDLERYAAQMIGRGLSAATVARHLSALSSWFRFCQREEVISHSPMPLVQRPKVSSTSTQVGLSREELRTLVAVAEDDGPRSAALVHMLGMLGLRISEAVGARVEDLGVDRGHRILQLRRKGGVRAQTALPGATAVIIGAVVGDRVSGPLLLSTRGGRPMHETSARRLLNRLVAEALSPVRARTCTPHTLRHSFVSLSLSSGIPLHQVQHAVSHSSPTVTMRYARAVEYLDDHAVYGLSDYVLALAAPSKGLTAGNPAAGTAMRVERRTKLHGTYPPSSPPVPTDGDIAGLEDLRDLARSLLSDGKWQPVQRIRARLADTVQPGMAYRCGADLSRGDGAPSPLLVPGRRGRQATSDLIDRGARYLAFKALDHADFVYRDGEGDLAREIRAARSPDGAGAVE